MTTTPPASETPAPLVATPSDECEGDTVAVYDQCGGDTWEGSTCCEDGLECVVMGKSTCYSQVRTREKQQFAVLLFFRVVFFYAGYSGSTLCGG